MNMKQILKELGYSIDSSLRKLCGDITPEKRVMVVIIMILVFTSVNIYFTFSTIYNWGKEKQRREQLQIEHIRQLKLQEDSIKQSYDFNYEQRQDK
jgi:hypothetical protein